MSDTHHPHDDKPAPKTEALGPVRLAANYTPGGHEIDYTPNRNLFGFLAVMVVIMILAAIGVYQLFVSHTEGQLADAASAPSSQLAAQHVRDEALATSYGKVTVNAAGQQNPIGPPGPEDKLFGYRMPFAEARRLVLSDASRFVAAPKPEGWIHPDDATKK